ncbi:MAG: Uma2 family endonuclease [Planctomycetaceae bacterium]|nr:Uma2 family endonuclease [Planctomycetaceae bacterium]
MATVQDDFDLEERLRQPARGEPVWLLAKQFPHQGNWTVDEYLALVTDGLVEYVDGCLEFPPVPTKTHARVLRFLFELLRACVDARGLGETFSSGYPVKIANDRFREPDVVCVLNHQQTAAGEQFAGAADLVVEVVSRNDPNRDWVTKKAEYAAAGIPEYWIADPRDKTLTIFTLDDGATEYREAGRYQEGETARSILLDGLTVDVTAVFATE